MNCRYKKPIKYVQLDINKNMQEVIDFSKGDPTNLEAYTRNGVIVDTVDGRVEVKNGDFLVDIFGIRAMNSSTFYKNFEIE